MRIPRAARFLTTVIMLAVLFCSSAIGKDSAAPRDAVLIVAFGTSIEEARVSYRNVEKEVRAAFPGREVHWAWTAHSLLKTGPDGVPMLSPQEAFAKLATQGVKRLSVLSLHVIPGQEYTNLLATAKAFEGLPKGLETIRVSPPLLWDTEGMRGVATALIESLPKERKAKDAVVFVGHGTHHPAGVYYPALGYYLNAVDGNACVGTVDGDPDLEGITTLLQKRGVKKVWLVPLMTVAGDHALKDLFGDEPDSWKEQLTAKGIQVAMVKKGLGQNAAMIRRWVAGLQAVTTP